MDTLSTPFLLGVGAAMSPCLLPLYPGFIAYLAGTPLLRDACTEPLDVVGREGCTQTDAVSHGPRR